MKHSKKPPAANVHFRFPPEEKASFIEAARKAGFNFTTWVRLVLRKAAGIDKR